MKKWTLQNSLLILVIYLFSLNLGCSGSTSLVGNSNQNGNTPPASGPLDPGNPSASAVSDSEINVSWSTAGTGVTYKLVYQAGSAPANCTAGTVLSSSISATTFAVTGLTQNTAYGFRVCSQNSGLVSTGVTTSASTMALAEVTSLGVTVDSGTDITLNWLIGAGASDDFKISYVTGNTAPADCDTGTVIPASSVNAGTKAHAITGLTNTQEYSFRVCNIGVGGVNVSSGATVTKTVAMVLESPYNVQVVADSDSELTVSWASGGGTTAGFRLSYSLGSVSLANCTAGDVDVTEGTLGSATSYQVTGLIANRTYSFIVCAVDGVPSESTGVELAGQTSALPNLTDLAAAPLEDTVGLSWTSGGGTVTGYRISYATGATAPADCSSPNHTVGAVTNYTVPSLTPSTEYAFRVCAIDAGANNISSGQTVVSTTSFIGAPTSVTAEFVSDTKVKVSWASGGGTTAGFRVSKATGSAPADCDSNEANESTLNSSATEYTVTGLTGGTRYYFRVCAVNGDASKFASDTTDEWTLGSVTALYPTNGANWNDPINGTTGADIHSLTDTTCGSTSSKSQPCVNGGEMRKVDLPHLSSCVAGLSAVDSLGVFNWECKDFGAGNIKMVTNGFKPNKGLKDLVTVAGFKSNSVQFTEGAKSYSTEATGATSIWWSNPFSDVTTAGNTLNVDSTIYVIGADRTTTQMNLAAAKVSLVVLDGATLTGSGAVNVYVGDYYTWLEGDFSGGSSQVIQIHQVNGGRIHNSKIHGGGIGIYMTNTNYNTQRNDNHKITNTRVYSNASDGLLLQRGVEYLRVQDSFIFSNGGDGLQLGDSSGFAVEQNNNLVMDNVVIANNGGAGVYIRTIHYGLNFNRLFIYNNAAQGIVSSVNNTTLTLVGSTIAGNGSHGLQLVANSNVLYNMQHNTFAFNGANGIDGLNNNSKINSTVFYANSSSGVFYNPKDNYLFSNIASAYNTYGFFETVYSGGGASAINNLLVGNNSTANCGGADASSNVYTYPNCGSGGANNTSTVQTTSLNLSDDYNGQGISASYDSLVDSFVDTGSNYIAWLDSSIVSTSNIGNSRCVSTETCKQWDFRLKSTSDILNNSFVGTTTGDRNGDFVVGGACPAAVHGNEVIGTHLAHAIEILSDHKGNDDGLCQSGEECIYAPNFGSYQGEGNYITNECTFTDGTLTGIRIFAYDEVLSYVP